MKIEANISVLLKTTANSSSLRLWWACAFHLHDGMFNGSLGVGAQSASSSTVSINSEQWCGSVPQRRSGQSCRSPTAQQWKPFKHLKATDVPKFRKHFSNSLNIKKCCENIQKYCELMWFILKKHIIQLYYWILWSDSCATRNQFFPKIYHVSKKIYHVLRVAHESNHTNFSKNYHVSKKSYHVLRVAHESNQRFQ